MSNECVDDCHGEEQVGRRVAYLFVSADEVADEIAGAPYQVPYRGRQRARLQIPDADDAPAYRAPRYPAVVAALSADRAVVSAELMAAVGAAMTFEVLAGIAVGEFLPRTETGDGLF